MIPKSIPKSLQKSLKHRSSFVLGLPPIFKASWNHFRTSPILILELSPARGVILHILAMSTKVLKHLGKLFHNNLRVDETKTQIELIHSDDFFALSGAAELIYKGWDKEAIPLIKVKKSIISRFFERFFKN